MKLGYQILSQSLKTIETMALSHLKFTAKKKKESNLMIYGNIEGRNRYPHGKVKERNLSPHGKVKERNL